MAGVSAGMVGSDSECSSSEDEEDEEDEGFVVLGGGIGRWAGCHGGGAAPQNPVREGRRAQRLAVTESRGRKKDADALAWVARSRKEGEEDSSSSDGE